MTETSRVTSIGCQIDAVRTYDLASDDYVVEFHIPDGTVIAVLRNEDTIEAETADGRGLRIVLSGVELPLDCFRRALNEAMPWLNGGAPENADATKHKETD